MTKRTRDKINKKRLMRLMPYVLTAVATIMFVFLGSLDKVTGGPTLSLDAFAAVDYKISVDQLSELYTVADLSYALGLASARDAASNYVITETMYKAGQTSASKLEKPSITNLAVSRGVIEYVVADGDSMESIAAKYGVSTDEIRWSNGYKTTEVAVGDVLYIPSTSGIVYTVKSGETADSIASKYGSTAAEIIALNDLEVSGVSEGMRIVIKGGTLPEEERPEYEPPVVVQTYRYTYLGNSSSRLNVSIVAYDFYDAAYPYPNPNPGVPGWCTWYAWWWRATSPLSLGELGHEGRNANTWNYNYAYRGVGSEPVVGAVFQAPYGGGGYGHVGVVVGINGDGSIVVREMNYSGRYIVTEATIPASDVGNFNYIY